MGMIQVTVAMLRNKAEELSQMNEQFKNAANSLLEEESALRAQFEGEASDAFHSAFTKDITQMNNFYNAIARYVQILLTIAENYEKADRLPSSGGIGCITAGIIGLDRLRLVGPRESSILGPGGQLKVF